LGGSILRWLIFPTPIIVCMPLIIKTFALTISLMGGWVGYEVSKFSLAQTARRLDFYNGVNFIGSIWFIPILSTFGLVPLPLRVGYISIKSIDQGWSESLGGQGVYKFVGLSSGVLQWLQTNSIKIYLSIFILWVVLVMILSFGG
jgi:NADH-ubiquinone oxidoreductase chain 5